jgi:hypothetical protein
MKTMSAMGRKRTFAHHLNQRPATAPPEFPVSGR